MSIRGPDDIEIGGGKAAFAQSQRTGVFTVAATEAAYLEHVHTCRARRFSFAVFVAAIVLLVAGFVAPHWSSEVRSSVAVYSCPGCARQGRDHVLANQPHSTCLACAGSRGLPRSCLCYWCSAMPSRACA